MSTKLRVAVLGAGLMGAAIAAEYAAAGHSIAVTASPRTSPEEAVARVRALTPGADVTWCGSTQEATKGADVVIESLAEDIGLKQRELRAAQATAPDAIIGTNTSSLLIGDIARGLDDPAKLAGTHYLNPVAAFAVAELVAGPQTAPAVLDRFEELLRSMGKQPVRVLKDAPGFVINRLQFAFLREAVALVEGGIVSAGDLDLIASQGLAARWAVAGPFTVAAVGGAPVFRRVAAQVWPHLSNATVPPESVALRPFGPDEIAAERARIRAALLAGACRAAGDTRRE